MAALVERTAGLPLALSVTCARAASRPGAPLADLAAELADARGPAGRAAAPARRRPTCGPSSPGRWTSSASPAARAFRLLSLHPGPDISAPAAASLIAATLPQARAALAELVRASLLTEDAAGRFGCHDLLRAYAVELSAASRQRGRPRRRPPPDRSTTTCAPRTRRRTGVFPARGQAAAAAGRSRASPPRSSADRADGVRFRRRRGRRPGYQAAYEAALGWFRAEQRVLRGVLELAAAHGLDEHCWKLAWYWAPKLKRRGRMHEVLAVQRTALAAADRLGDADALAHVHYDLGHVSGRLARLPGRRPAPAAGARPVHRARRPGRRRAGPARARAAARQQDRYAEALEHGIEALRLRRAFADSAAVAYSENSGRLDPRPPRRAR